MAVPAITADPAPAVCTAVPAITAAPAPAVWAIAPWVTAACTTIIVLLPLPRPLCTAVIPVGPTVAAAAAAQSPHLFWLSPESPVFSPLFSKKEKSL